MPQDGTLKLKIGDTFGSGGGVDAGGPTPTVEKMETDGGVELVYRPIVVDPASTPGFSLAGINHPYRWYYPGIEDEPEYSLDPWIHAPTLPAALKSTGDSTGMSGRWGQLLALTLWPALAPPPGGTGLVIRSRQRLFPPDGAPTLLVGWRMYCLHPDSTDSSGSWFNPAQYMSTTESATHQVVAKESTVNGSYYVDLFTDWVEGGHDTAGLPVGWVEMVSPSPSGWRTLVNEISVAVVYGEDPFAGGTPPEWDDYLVGSGGADTSLWKNAGIHNPGGGTLNLNTADPTFAGAGGGFWIDPGAGDLGGVSSTPVSPDPGVSLTPGMLPPYSGTVYGNGTNGALDGDPDYWNQTGNEHISFVTSGYFDLTTYAGWTVPDHTTWTGWRFVIHGAITELTVEAFISGASQGTATAATPGTGMREAVVDWTGDDRLITAFEAGTLTLRVSVIGTGDVYSAEMLFGYPYGSAFYTDWHQPPTETAPVGGGSTERSWRAVSCVDGQPHGFTDAEFLWTAGAAAEGASGNFTGAKWTQSVLQEAGNPSTGQKEQSIYEVGLHLFQTNVEYDAQEWDQDEAAPSGLFPNAYGAMNPNGDWWTDDNSTVNRGSGLVVNNWAGVSNVSDMTVTANVETSASHDAFDGSSFGSTDHMWTLRAVDPGSLQGGPHSIVLFPGGGSLYECNITVGSGYAQNDIVGKDWFNGPNVATQVFDAVAGESGTLTFPVGYGYARSDGLLGIAGCLDISSRTDNMIEGNGSSQIEWTSISATRSYDPPPVRYIYAATGWEGTSNEGTPGGGGGAGGAEWHTADNYEPPPPGKPAGDGGVEDGWVHVSWMRRKDLGPGSGRTGRLKLRVAEPGFGGGGGGTNPCLPVVQAAPLIQSIEYPSSWTNYFGSTNPLSGTGYPTLTPAPTLMDSDFTIITNGEEHPWVLRFAEQTWDWPGTDQWNFVVDGTPVGGPMLSGNYFLRISVVRETESGWVELPVGVSCSDMYLPDETPDGATTTVGEPPVTGYWTVSLSTGTYKSLFDAELAAGRLGLLCRPSKRMAGSVRVTNWRWTPNDAYTAPDPTCGDLAPSG